MEIEDEFRKFMALLRVVYTVPDADGIGKLEKRDEGNDECHLDGRI